MNKNTPKDQPLVSFSVTNPVTYIKRWWKSVMAKEGVDVSFKVHPVTAVMIAVILVAGGAGAGWIIKAAHESAQRIPLLNTILPTFLPETTPDPWRNTAYSGILRKVSDGKYYLQTGDGEAITLAVNVSVNLEKYIGKRIFASGRFNKLEEVLYVTDASDLEYVIQATTIPTVSPTSTPFPEELVTEPTM